MSGIRTIIGSLSALMIIFGNSPVTIATAQDQPIKRTELHRSYLADVVGKEAVIYIADVMPGAEGGRHTHLAKQIKIDISAAQDDANLATNLSLSLLH